MKKIIAVLLIVLVLVGCSRELKKNEVYIIDDEKSGNSNQSLDILVMDESEILFTYQSYIHSAIRKYEDDNDIKVNFYFDDADMNMLDCKVDLVITSYSDDWLFKMDKEKYYKKNEIIDGIPKYFSDEYIIPFSLKKMGYLMRKSQLNLIYDGESQYENLDFNQLYEDWTRIYNIDMDLEDEANRIISEAFPSVKNYLDFDVSKTIDFVKNIIDSVKESDVEAWLLEFESDEYGISYRYSYEDLKYLMINNINRDSDFYSQAVFEEMNSNILSGYMNQMYDGYGAFLVRDGNDIIPSVEGIIVPKDTDNLYHGKKLIEYLLDKDNQLEFYKGIKSKYRYEYSPIYIDLYDEMEVSDSNNGYGKIASEARYRLRDELKSGVKIESRSIDYDIIMKLRKYHMAVFDFIKNGDFSSGSYEKLEEVLKGIILP